MSNIIVRYIFRIYFFIWAGVYTQYCQIWHYTCATWELGISDKSRLPPSLVIICSVLSSKPRHACGSSDWSACPHLWAGRSKRRERARKWQREQTEQAKLIKARRLERTDKKGITDRPHCLLGVLCFLELWGVLTGVIQWFWLCNGLALFPR